MKFSNEERIKLLIKYYGGNRNYWLRRLKDKRNSIRGTKHRRYDTNI